MRPAFDSLTPFCGTAWRATVFSLHQVSLFWLVDSFTNILTVLVYRKFKAFLFYALHTLKGIAMNSKAPNEGFLLNVLEMLFKLHSTFFLISRNSF